MTRQYLVEVARMERITFAVEADDAEDAQARYLMDGDEVASRTERLEILDVKAHPHPARPGYDGSVGDPDVPEGCQR